MTNLQKFAAQRLTKRQMNDIRGGWRCFVVLEWGRDDNPNVGYWIDVPGANADDAVKNLPHIEGAVGVVC